MSYSDPISLTISGAAVSLPRTGSSLTSGEFTSPDRQTKLTVSHQYGRRIRRTLRVTTQKISSDPLVPSQSVAGSMSAYIVVDTPQNGFSAAEAKAVVDALVAYLSASSGVAVTKLIGGES